DTLRAGASCSRRPRRGRINSSTEARKEERPWPNGSSKGRTSCYTSRWPERWQRRRRRYSTSYNFIQLCILRILCILYILRILHTLRILRILRRLYHAPTQQLYPPVYSSPYIYRSLYSTTPTYIIQFKDQRLNEGHACETTARVPSR
ncbi:uncharacterized protein BDZ99DRAFT_534116, partial [Mytilinidion resinicola]